MYSFIARVGRYTPKVPNANGGRPTTVQNSLAMSNVGNRKRYLKCYTLQKGLRETHARSCIFRDELIPRTMQMMSLVAILGPMSPIAEIPCELHPS